MEIIMELTPKMFLIVCPLIFLGGLVDSIAGGGGLISLPAYLIAGLPPHYAIGTNKLSSSAGTTISAVRFCKNKFVDWAIAVPSVILSLAGSYLGANLSLHLEEKILKYVLMIILPVVAAYVLWGKALKENERKREIHRIKACLIACLASFFIGGYDGFYGPGTGSFLILIYAGLAKMDIRKASGNTKLVNLASNIAALTAYLIGKKVLFPLGAVAAVFGIAGNYIGSGLAIKNGQRIIRPIIMVVLALLFVKIIIEL